MSIQQELIIGPTVSRVVSTMHDRGEKGELNIIPFKENYKIGTGVLLETLDNIGTESAPDILPPNCRFAHTDGRYTFVIVEEAPQLRTIKLDIDLSGQKDYLKRKKVWKNIGAFDKGAPYTFRLAMPFIFYALCFDQEKNPYQAKVYASPEPLTGVGTPLYKLPLPNINTNGSICLGDSGGFAPKATDSLSTAVQKVLNRFWFNNFNTDYMYAVEEYFESHIKFVGTFFEWEYYSVNDPMFIYNAPWIPSGGRTVQNLIDRSPVVRNTNRQPLNFTSLLSKIDAKPRTKLTKSGAVVINNFVDAYMVNGAYLVVGQELTINNITGTLVNFIGNRHHSYPLSLEICDDKQEIHRFKLDSDFVQKAAELLCKEQKNTKLTTSKGEILKRGDIFYYSLPGRPPAASIMDRVITHTNGAVETVINGVSIFLHNVNLEKFDESILTVNGEAFDRAKTFVLNAPLYETNKPLLIQKEIKFHKFSLGLNSRLTAVYVNTHNLSEKTPTQVTSDQKITIDGVIAKPIDTSELNPLGVYKSFCSMEVPSARNPHYYSPDVGIIKYAGDRGRHNTPPYNLHTAREATFTKERIFIPGVESDVDFKVGDLIAMAAWNTPSVMFKPHVITKFTCTGEGTLNPYKAIVHSEDIITKKACRSVLVNYGSNIINMNYHRHIVLEHENVKIGAYVQAKKANIVAFPKKDINAILAFITDAEDGEVLVLCSNGCSIPFSQLSNFHIYEENSKKYQNSEVTEFNMSSLSVQVGDMFLRMGIPHIIAGTQTKKITYFYKLATLGDAVNTGYTKSDYNLFTRYGFLPVRRPIGLEETDRRVPAIPDCLGGFISQPNAVMNVPESFLNSQESK